MLIFDTNNNNYKKVRYVINVIAPHCGAMCFIKLLASQ